MKRIQILFILIGLSLALGVFLVVLDSITNIEPEKDYSSQITQSIEPRLYDEVDDFILSQNKNLTFKDSWKIKDLVRYYTISESQYLTMISLYGVESNFYQNANSFLGAKYGRGLGQVSEIALAEYNRKNNTSILPEELYDLEINIKVSCWLYNYYQRIYNLDEIGTLMSYNKGYNGYIKNRNDTGYSNKILMNKSKFDKV